MIAVAAARPVSADGAGQAPPRGSTVEITARDFAFSAPDTVPAGMVTIHLRNDGLMVHHARLVRLDAGRTLRQLERELVDHETLPRWAADVGGPGAVGPGGESRVTLKLDRGHHVILSAERLADGSTAVMRGMYRAVEVVGSAASIGTPRADVVLEMSAGDLRVSNSLVAGRQRVLVRNRATESYELRIYRLVGGQAEEALLDWLRTETTVPPAVPVGGVAGLAPGTSATIDLTLERGQYVLAWRAAPLRGAESLPRARTLSVR